MKNKVTIFVLTYNRLNDLKKCLDSIRKQTYKDFDILVIDNGSDDGTIEFLQKQSDTKLLVNKTKRLSYLFNLGYKESEGDIIGYLADDVEVDKDWLKNIIGTLESSPEIAAVSGPIISTRPQEMHNLFRAGRKSWLLKPFLWFYEKILCEGRLLEPGILFEAGTYSMGAGLKESLKIPQPIEIDLLTTSSMGIRKSVLEQIGGFDEAFCFNHADGDLFIRLKKAGYKLVFHPKVIALHHVRGGHSRNPFFIGRDTAYFYLKDIRPKTFFGWLKFLANIKFFNAFWFFKAIQSRSITQLNGFWGFIVGVFDYLTRKKYLRGI